MAPIDPEFTRRKTPKVTERSLYRLRDTGMLRAWTRRKSHQTDSSGTLPIGRIIGLYNLGGVKQGRRPGIGLEVVYPSARRDAPSPAMDNNPISDDEETSIPMTTQDDVDRHAALQKMLREKLNRLESKDQRGLPK